MKVILETCCDAYLMKVILETCCEVPDKVILDVVRVPDEGYSRNVL